MTSIELDAIKNRIRKLLALSKSPNENEAMAALEKARKLMDEYQLSEGDCKYEAHEAKATKRYSQWRGVLAQAMEYLYCCKSWRDEITGQRVFFGESIDALMASEMYLYLSKTTERMAKQNIRKTAKRKYREAYKLGIAASLAVRIDTLGTAVSWAPQRETKMAEINREVAARFNIVTSQRKKASIANPAFRRGSAAGGGISLNRQTTGGQYLEDRK